MIIFHHIPRTGGIFIERQIRKIIKPHRRVQDIIYSNDKYERLSVGFFSGHCNFGRLNIQKNDFVFSFFRDPIDRLHSLYNHMSKNLLPNKRYSTWFSDVILFNLFSNDWRHFVDYYLSHNGIGILSDGRRICDEVSIGGYANYKIYDFVGITEKMTESLDILGKKLNIKLNNGQKINSCEYEKDDYREDELRKFLECENFYYNLACSNI